MSRLFPIVIDHKARERLSPPPGGQGPRNIYF
jgi:hypothetical protein